MKKKIVLMITMIVSTFMILSIDVNASYNYTPWMDSIESAHSMSITRIIDQVNLVDIHGQPTNVVFDNLRDTFVYENKIYVSDANKNKVHVLNDKYQYLHSFPNSDLENEQLNSPQGIYVVNNYLYVADSENNRIAVFDIQSFELVFEVKDPEDDIFTKTPFKPHKIAVDRVGRMMVVANDIFEGIMEFDASGKFNRFFGTNTITMNLVEALIYKLSSKKQREKMSLKLQTSFTSIDLDDSGYIYAVSRNEPNTPVKKLNFKGNNILLNNGYINVLGDSEYPNRNEKVPLGASSIIDITSNRDNNRFTILDNKRGRLFTYDVEGHLLYISGGLGTQSNTLQGPTSVTYFNENLIVTDNVSKSIIIYEPTDFGALINEATKAYYEMDYEKSKQLWEKVLAENSNYFLAYAGVGKTQLRNQEWELAVKNLKLGHDYYNYSKAYEQYRNEKLTKFLPAIIVVALLGSGYGIYTSIRSSVKREKGDDE